LPIRAELGAGVAKKIIQGRKSKQLKICSCFLKTIKSKEKEKYKFSLYNLNIYWQSVSEKKIYFKLGLDIGEYMFNVPKNEDIIIINAKGKRPKIVVQNTKSYYEYILFSGKKGSQGIAFDKMKKGNDLIYTVPQKKELSTSDLSLLITDGKTKKWKKFNYNCKVTYVSKKNPKIKLRIKKQTVLWGETLKLPWYKKRVKKKKYKKSYKGFYVCDSKYYVIGSKLKYLPKGKMKFTLKIK